jgi:hypothetical protein
MLSFLIINFFRIQSYQNNVKETDKLGRRKKFYNVLYTHPGKFLKPLTVVTIRLGGQIKSEKGIHKEVGNGYT